MATKKAASPILAKLRQMAKAGMMQPSPAGPQQPSRPVPKAPSRKGGYKQPTGAFLGK